MIEVFYLKVLEGGAWESEESKRNLRRQNCFLIKLCIRLALVQRHANNHNKFSFWAVNANNVKIQTSFLAY